MTRKTPPAAPAGPERARKNKGGRKKGGKNSERLAVAQKALKDGITPLEVILGHMRDHHARAIAAKEPATREEHMAIAAAAAKDAAPYVHPRLNAIDHNHSGAMNWRDVFKMTEAARDAALLRNKITGDKPQ